MFLLQGVRLYTVLVFLMDCVHLGHSGLVGRSYSTGGNIPGVSVLVHYKCVINRIFTAVYRLRYTVLGLWYDHTVSNTTTALHCKDYYINLSSENCLIFLFFSQEESGSWIHVLPQGRSGNNLNQFCWIVYISLIYFLRSN